MTWLKGALGLIAIINWVMSRLDANEKAEALAALWSQEFMREDKEAIETANAARRTLERELADGSRGVRAPDPDSRT